ncbi:FAD-dependent monooxygenase [Mycobacterium sp. 141]|uniref:FAD-dependent monooxygenase n=1 Tax=Mycobacterium sp. 141 TaxID=1120797 RepID=UPI0009D99AB9|nr:FAD-dependent monooxygenase [Mycobacterium sp. 141]
MTDVLVVGAGPTGLVLAAELARRGVVPRVIDAGPAEVKESRAVAVVARSLELLDDLGVADAVIERGIPLRALNFYHGSTRLAEFDITSVDSPFQMDLCIAQWKTCELLREKVESLGVQVEWNTRLTSCRSDEAGVSADIVHGDGRTETCSATWLVGCDGAHSTVREGAGIDRELADLGRGFILGDVAAPWGIERDRFHVWFAKGGLVAVFPMSGGYWRIISDTGDDNPPSHPGLSAFATQIADRTPLEADLSDLQWSSAFVAREGLVKRFRRGQVFLAGDAAHNHSPVGGQGMNTGMQDAYNLGWKLAQVVGGCSPLLLDSYQAERRPVAVSVVNATSTATRVATENKFVARRARRHALRLFSQLSAAQQKFANALGEHAVNYRSSALVFEHWSDAKAEPWSNAEDGGPEAGEVFRDAYVETCEGPVALRRLYRGLGHHLVLFAAEESNPDIVNGWKRDAEEVMAGRGQVHLITRCHLAIIPADGVFADVRSDAHDRYGVQRPSLYLIRPDKYVGYRSDTMNFDPIADYFGLIETGRVTRARA